MKANGKYIFVKIKLKGETYSHITSKSFDKYEKLTLTTAFKVKLERVRQTMNTSEVNVIIPNIMKSVVVR